jgi:scyllo-inositol 2-dehydrogenase (NADP+)
MLHVGIIGFGRIGADHAGWIAATDNAQVVCVFDPTEPRRLLAEKMGLPGVETMDQLLADDDVHAVLVATPTSMHFDHAMSAIRAGKHVMIEKPMALDYAQAKQLADAAQARRVMISVFQCRRWDVDYLTVKNAIAAEMFGKIINIESRLGQWSSCVGPAAKEYRPNWRNEKSFGGGALYDWGSHFIDQLWQLFIPAKPVRVFAQLRGNVWSHDCDDFARVCIDFDNGAVGMCEINTTTTRPLPRWHIDGTLGSASAPHSLSFNTREWAQLQLTHADNTTPVIRPAETDITEPTLWSTFARACGGECQPLVTVDSVLMTMRLLDAARESSLKGRVIDIAAL